MSTKTNFRRVQYRTSFADGTFLTLINSYASRPRLLLEVFVRKNLGKNYFNIGSVFSVAWRVALFPLLVHYIPKLWDLLFSHNERGVYGNDWWNFHPERHYLRNDTFDFTFLKIYGGWYVLLLAFLIFAIIRWTETMGNRGNSGNVSTHMGDINPFFFKLDFLGKPTNENISIVYEPLVFLAVGFLALTIGQNVGWLIIVSAIFYSLGNYSDFKYAEKVLTNTQDMMKNNKALQQHFEGTANNGNQNSPNGNEGNGWIEPAQDDDRPTFAQ